MTPPPTDGEDLRPSFIVGVGASAGGIEAVKALLHGVGPGSGMAYVVVLHLSPDLESHVAEVLQTATGMRVVQAEEGAPVERDRVYVVAPDATLAIHGSQLRLTRPIDRAARSSRIDAFLESLAVDQGERAAAVILSGTGRDGARGVLAVKAAGGICLVQTPDTAEHAGMPSAAIETGAVDQALPLDAIAEALARRVADSLAGDEGEDEDPPQATDEQLGAILAIVSSASGLDFRDYKRGTLHRRIYRRMLLRNLTSWEEYARHLASNADEVSVLYGDLLIGVSRFFRDPEVWEALSQEVIPGLLEGCDANRALRVWVPGCSTGEEAYSVAMLWLEALERLPAGIRPQLQVFATDADADALGVARQGSYPEEIAAHMSEERLQRFFTARPGRYHIRRFVREAVTFSAHNLLREPPFSRLDMVSCRNLLIYLRPHVQERLFELFHFSLRPEGVLLLGSAENLGRRADLFAPIAERYRIYRRQQSTRAGWFPTGSRSAPPRELQASVGSGRAEGLSQRLQRFVLEQHTDPCVVIDRRLEILYRFGPTLDYLTQPLGEARMDLASWTRPGLYLAIRRAVGQASETKLPVTVTALGHDHPQGAHRVECTVEPLTSVADTDELLLVTFRPIARPSLVPPADTAPVDDTGAELERDLAHTREELRAALDQLDTLSQDHRTSHEEQLSLNEELQSSNEELETSKEELQSLNEEMDVVNRQLHGKNEELHLVNDDLHNLLLSTDTAAVFLDRELRVRRFTPAAAKVMRIVPSDTGRPLAHIKLRFADDRLVEESKSVQELLGTAVREVKTDDGKWWSRSVRPYQSEAGRIDGVCIAFADITAQKEHAEAIERERRFAEAIVETIRTSVLVLDPDLQVRSANRHFYETFLTKPEDTLGRTVYELGNGRWDVAPLRELLEAILPEQKEVRDYELEQAHGPVGRRVMRLNAHQLSHVGSEPLLLLSIEDITERRDAEVEVLEFTERLVREQRLKDEFIAVLGHELRNPLAAITHGIELLGVKPIEIDRIERVHGLLDRQATRLTAMVDQLLDIVRVMSGKVELQLEVLDLNDAIRTAMEAVEPMLSGKAHAVELALPEDGEALVLGDSTRLIQVLENLIGNAAKYTATDEHIWLSVDVSEPDTIAIHIRDDGIGIRASELAHVFEPFTQGRRARDRAPGGLGLGLSLVKGLVGLHSGTLVARSGGHGQGSEFVVRLPRISDFRRASRAPEQIAEVAHGRRILVVDDEPDAGDLLSDLLRLRGHTVTTVRSGGAALAASAEFRPDVVLLDLGLPDMTGYDVAEALRRGAGDTALRLIALTGYQKDADRLRDAGFDNHLLKPIDLSQLDLWLAE